MITKGCLVRYVGEGATGCGTGRAGKVYLTISDPYVWTGAGWQGRVVKLLDPCARSRQTIIALDLLDLVSQ
jgi:hypothetical protein